MRNQPRLSVLIPTRNRCDRLYNTIQLLAEQEDRKDFELVVVDNGSTDQTPQVLERAVECLDIDIVAVSQPKEGVGAACNAGLEVARGDWILRLGADTEPASRSLVRAHLEMLESVNDSKFGILGKILWKDPEKLSPFQLWLDSGGPQNHYQEIQAGWVSPRNYFYGSHHSASKEAFFAVGGYDERIIYGFDDPDIGYRLEKWGLKLLYRPDLLVYHDHPTTLSNSLLRMETVGQAAAVYNTIGQAGRHERIGEPSNPKRALARLLDPTLTLLSHLPLPRVIQHRIWHYAHLARYARGYSRELSRKPPV